MSNWTHVAAIFRCDVLNDWSNLSNEELDDTLDHIFGKRVPEWPADIDDEKSWAEFSAAMEEASEHPELYVPCGSEGSLQLSVWENPDRSCAARYTVSVFGDLRDHHSNDAIKKWFFAACDKVRMLRQATCTSYNELNGTESWTWYSDSL